MTPKQTKADKSKGFTLVELLVTLAIIAALATVSVVGYMSFINSAERSADEQLVSQMNTLLAANETLGAPSHITDAQALLRSEAVSDFAAKSKNCSFYWLARENRIVVWESDDQGSGGSAIFPDGLAENVTELPVGWYALDKEYIINTLADDADGAALLSVVASVTSDEETIVLPKGKTLKVNAQALTSALRDLVTARGAINITFDLNGGVLQMCENADGNFFSLSVPSNARVEIIRGSIEAENNKSYLAVDSTATLLLRDVKFNSVFDCILVSSEATALAVERSELVCSGTAVSVKGTVEGASISIFKSTLEGETAINVTSPCYLDVSSSTMRGYNHALILRGGSATLTNNDIYNYFDIKENAAGSWDLFLPDFDDEKYRDWQAPANAPFAAVTIGNDTLSTRYNYPSSCVMVNNRIHVVEGYMAVYIEGMSEENKATLTDSGNEYFYHDDGTYSGGSSPISVEPKEYSADMDVKNSPIIYAKEPESFVVINGVEH